MDTIVKLGTPEHDAALVWVAPEVPDMNHYRYDIFFSACVWATENVIRAAHELASRAFDGYTISEGHGGWMGTQERSYTLTVIQKENDASIGDIAEGIKRTFGQECVLVTKTLVQSKLV